MNSSSTIVVVTGTDTEIGKTTVSAGLGRALAERGVDVIAVKPVESGTSVEVEPGEDGVVLARATGQSWPTSALVRLREPLAPPVAADIDGVALDLDDWCQTIETLADGADIVLVEGAGGVLSPLTSTQTARDLADKLGAATLVVAPNRLGSLNHTLLVNEALASAGIDVVGVVYSAPADKDASTRRNAQTLRDFSGIERVAELGRVDDVGAAADQLAEPCAWLVELID